MSSDTFADLAPESLANDSAQSLSPDGLGSAADVPPIAGSGPAPYGTTAGGSARRKPGRKPGQRNGTGRAAQAATAPSRASGGKFTKDYRPAVRDLLELPQGVLLGASAALGEPAFALDAATIDAHTEPLANAVHSLALEKPEVAAALEKMTTASGYMALVAAVVPLVMQLAANHQLVPPGFMSTHAQGILTAGAKAAAVDNPADYPPFLLWSHGMQQRAKAEPAARKGDAASQPGDDAPYIRPPYGV